MYSPSLSHRALQRRCSHHHSETLVLPYYNPCLPPSFLESTMSTSFVSQIMQPGGGVMLLPFVRFVIGILLVLTVVAAVVDVARIHMIILSFLSGGLLISLSFFESEFKKVRAARSGGGSSSEPSSSTTSAPTTTKAGAKTD